METLPPQLFLRFFRWYCDPKLRDHIEGDLIEEYNERLKMIGKGKADRRFIMDVLLLFRPAIIRSFHYRRVSNYGMYKNYLKTSWRHFAKNRVFSLINISGLSLGLTCSILIALWVQDEYRIDAFHENGDRIFVVTSCEYSGTEVNGSYDTPGLLAEEMKTVFPEVESAANYAWTSYNTFAVDDKTVKLPGNYAGADFFKIFSYPLLLGTKEAALNSPESIAISRKMAIDLFGSPEQAMDKAIKFDNYKELKVAAVFEDLNDNVSDKFQYLLSWELFKERHPWVQDWHNSGPLTFVRLHQDVNAVAFASKIRTFIKNYDKEYSENDRLELGLQLFSERYLRSNFESGHVSGGRIEYVKLFEFVAVFILLIACINFMNLSTARAIKRGKEIGVRKVNGAMKASLVMQFMLEAFLFTVLATLFALILVQLLLPQFNLLTGKNMSSPLMETGFWTGIAGLLVITAMVSGSYPAFLLSSFKPISVFRNNVTVSPSSISFRKVLVVVQFALSMIFIAGMIVITRQVDFIQSKNLGYQKENLVYLRLTGRITTKFDAFKHEVLQIPGITSVSKMSQRPVQIENSTGDVQWEGKDPNTKPTFTQAYVGYDFIKTMQATMLYGRDFSEDRADSASYIINETALKILEYVDPIGMPLTFWGVEGTIIGVVKDFHFNSLHIPIKPMVLRLACSRCSGYALIRFEPGKTSPVLAALEDLHEKMNPDFPFAHQFADEEYGLLYEREQLIKRLSGYFAFLAIFISCLGLLGLVIFTTEQRSKELGIRKVLGANLSEIVGLLSKDFVKLIFISFLLSSPVAWYVMTGWLEGFEYHIDIQWWMFVFAAASAMLIALVTISFQAIKAGLTNPVKSLRSE